MDVECECGVVIPCDVAYDGDPDVSHIEYPSGTVVHHVEFPGGLSYTDAHAYQDCPANHNS